MTTENVPEEQVSEKEPVSPEAKSEEEKPEAQPLTEERVQELIAVKAEEMLEKGKTLGRREMQGIKDREVQSEKRRGDLAERKVGAYEKGFTGLDEDTRAIVNQRKLESENEFYRTREQEEATSRQQQEQAGMMEQSLRDEVTALGIDPTDKRIDYASDAGSYFEGRKRFSESVAKIVGAGKEGAEKAVLEKVEEKNKQFEAEIRKKYGLDSQDTTTPMGVVNQSDADFMADWGAYNLPDTKENRDRYEEIKKKHY